MTYTQILEWLGFLSGVACVYLLVTLKWQNWPVGLVNSASWLLLFWAYGIYLNSLLQIVYIAIGIYGWWYWVKGGKKNEEDTVPVRRGNVFLGMMIFIWVAIGTAVGVELLSRTGDPFPFWDALTTSVSIAALMLDTRKIIVSWFLWISVDVVYFVMYGSQNLWLTALTQVVFGGLCVAGIYKWRAELFQQEIDAEYQLEEAVY